MFFAVYLENMQLIVERGFFKSPAIKLDDAQALSNKPDVQVLRVGKFQHPKYGEFEITKQTLAEMKDNFDNKIRGVDIAFDYFHNSDQEAAGWPTELYLTEQGAALWAKVDWTPTAAQKLSDREIRYFSPDFAFEWKDPESGKIYKNVLFGGGLTNRPFVKDMAAIVAAEEREQMKLDELEKMVLKLKEDGEDMQKKMEAAQLATKAHLEKLAKPTPEAPAAPAKPIKAEEAEQKIDPSGDTDVDTEGDDMEKLKAELAETKKKLAEYMEAAEKANAAKVLAEKEAAFTLLLTEGKACVAQKDAYIKGDMNQFIKLAQPVNLVGQGSAVTPTDSAGDREDKVLKLAEDLRKKDPKLTGVEAINLANKQVK